MVKAIFFVSLMYNYVYENSKIGSGEGQYVYNDILQQL